MTDPQDTETVERLIPAEASAIFDLVADASRHQDIDGSGSVRGAKGGSSRLSLGSKFGMSMKIGLPYSMVNEVVEFEADRLIAWQTRGPGPLKIIGGRIWRYELEPTDGGTLVKETWDISQESKLSKAGAAMQRGRAVKGMTATLARIEELLAR